MGNYPAIESLKENGNLRTLDLSKKLTPENYLKHIRGTCLEGCLQNIPLDIIYYDTISMFEEINLSFNFITYVPEEFSLRVPHLRHLDVSHNQLTGLPSSFHLLLHLRILNLSFNKIQTLPEPVVHLSKLETLNMAHNLLTDLPNSIRSLKELKRLNVSHNNLRALSESLLECLNLKILVTIGNNLIHPPQSVCDQGSSATLLYLSQKRIETKEKTSNKASMASKGVFVRVRGQQVMASVANPESASREYKQAQGTTRTNKRKCPLVVPENATALAPDQLRETILGLVYGACIGDAFGLNTEGLSRDECLFFYFNEHVSLSDRISDLLRSYFPPGDWSSNVDIMLLALDSLMRWGGVVDELELVSQMIQWRVHGFCDIDPFPGHPLSPLLQQVISTEGYVAHPHSVAEGLHKKIQNDHNKGLSLNINLLDNSCLPAAVVLGIPNFYMKQEVAMNAERICKATHPSPLSVACCIFTATVAAFLLQGKFQSSDADVTSVLKEATNSAITVIQDEKMRSLFEKAFDPCEPSPPETASNDALLTVKFVVSAISACTNKDKSFNSSFEEILSRFMKVGGIGLSAHCCVLGGILGAYFGYSSIPHRWLKQLPKENVAWLNTKMNLLLDLFGLP